MKYWYIFLTSLLFISPLIAEEGNAYTLHDYYEIAKHNFHDINSIRSQMDRINSEILKLLTERTAYVKRAGDLKSQTTKIADDRQRVADQEKKIIDQSIELGLPTEIGVPTFRAIMETSIKFQQAYIDELTMQRD